jgi:hypothetical protein
MKKLQSIVLVFVLFVFCAIPVKAQEFKWQDDEELTYGVDWTFVRLGKIYLKNLGKEEINGIQSNHIRLTIESNPLLFWLDNQSVYDSYITDSLKVIRFISDENVDDKVYKARYDFDYSARKIHLTLQDLENPEQSKQKIIDMKPKLYDGISLIYYARMNSLYFKKDTVSTFIEDKSGDVIFNFINLKRATEIDSLQEEVKTVYFDGTLKVTGIAGVTGPFEAWFSNDAYRVPILAYLEVFIGSVKISLERWKYWQPPL